MITDVFNVDTFPYSVYALVETLKRKRGNQGGKKVYYKNLITAFDIETSRLPKTEHSFMYIWQFALDDIGTVVGRTWEDFKLFLETLSKFHNDEKLVVFVHNLSYEFQFLHGILEFKNEDVFCVNPRKILKATFGNFEFRDSYLQTNMSLAEFTNKYNVKHQKLSGDDFDYKEVRYPWSPIPEEKLKYCLYDVWGLVEAIKAEMEIDGDDLYSIPLTSTGYVRRDAKKAMQKHVARGYIQSIIPPFECYVLLREAFRGGDTHANRFYSGKLLKNVHSVDRSSSYPDVQCNCKFPVGKFVKLNDISKDHVNEILYKRKRAAVFRIKIKNLKLKYWWWGCPYLSTSKCRNIENADFDNGRILSADYLETTITDVDFQIMNSEYIFEWEVVDLWHSNYGMLPPALTDLARAYFRRKTELKGDVLQAVYYMKSKNKLNAIYGMTAQDPVKATILYDDCQYNIDLSKTNSQLYEETTKHAFMTYAWATWTTAWARLRLHDAIHIVGDKYVYGDTDSVKHIGAADFTAYNEQRKRDSIATSSYAIDSQGITHYMGVYEDEGTYKKFKTLGAKKYCYVDEEDELHTTIAGVNKKKGAKELAQIENFDIGFTFSEAGGTESVYNDEKYYYTVKIDGHDLPITSNVTIKDSTYTILITDEYFRLLANSERILKKYY